MTRKDSCDIICDVTESKKYKHKLPGHVRLEWGVSHAKFQLSIGNGSGAIARKHSGGGCPLSATGGCESKLYDILVLFLCMIIIDKRRVSV